jgi:copper chaperone
MAETTLKINGMSCQHCVMRIRKAFEILPGINSLDVNIGTAYVSYDASLVKREDLEAAVVAAGYTVAQ